MHRIKWFRSLVLLVALTGLLAVSIAPAAAQGSPTPIAVGEVRTGEVTPANFAPAFLFTSTAPQTITVQVLALTPGFAPAFRVVDPAGVNLQIIGNPTNASIVQGDIPISGTGQYQIVVQSANGSGGQFVISVQPGAPLLPPTPLIVGQPAVDVVDPQTPLRSYTFTASPTDVLLLTVRSEDLGGQPPFNGPIITLRDAQSNETLLLGSIHLIGARLRIPRSTQNIVLDVAHSGAPQQELYYVCLETESGSIPCPGSQAASTPSPTPLPGQPTPIPPTAFVPVQIPPGAPCAVASSSGATINIRSGPSTTFPVVTQLAPTAVASVIGRLPDNSWYQVNVNGIIGWVSASVIVVGGQCGIVPFVTPTPTPTLPVSVTPSATATPTPTATSGGGLPPGGLTLLPPVFTLRPPIFTLDPGIIVPLLTPVPTLNFSLPPNYGSRALTSGFTPDPSTVGITSGGPVNVSYLGGSCVGFATSAPDFSVNYTAGAFPLLRFYFIGGGDTTMIINAPNGSYFCNDDSFGTRNPTIDFNSPQSGRYDIWIGSFSAGTNIAGTLYITESSANHP